MKLFRFIAYTSITLNLITRLINGRCFTIKKTDYKSWIYYVVIIDLSACFYEKREIKNLKMVSLISILVILVYLLVHFIYYFSNIKK